MKTEIWKDIKGYIGLYQISNLSRIKSLARNVNRGCKGIKKTKEKISSQRLTKTGYYQVMLCKDSKKKYYMTSRLVAINFLPRIKIKNYVNHINGIKTDNRIENLEWVNRSENQIHAYKTGLQKIAKGEQRGNVCKLNTVDIIIIKTKLKEGVSNKLLAKLFNVNPVTISNIKTGATWGHI